MQSHLFYYREGNAEVQEHHRESVCIITCEHSEGRSSGFSEAAAITITGTASIIEGIPGEAILKRYSEKLPFLKEFLNFQDCAMVKVNVSAYLLVKNFQDIYEYEF